MKKLFNRFTVPGSFAYNFAVTFSGSVFTVLIQVILTPILTRIYGPEAYGLFAVLNSIIVVTSLIATLRYQDSFVLVRDDQELFKLVGLTLMATIATCVLLFIAILLFKGSLLTLLNLSEIGRWIYLLPVAVFVFSINGVLSSWEIRNKFFKRRTMLIAGNSLMVRIFNIIYGIINFGSLFGLIIGELLGQIANLFILAKFTLVKHRSEIIKAFSWRSAQAISAKYASFPRFVLPSVFLTTLSNQLPIYFITFYFGALEVGFFSFAASLLALPVNVLSNSVQPVFYQKIAEMRAHSDNLGISRITLDLYKKLMLIGALPVALLTVFGENLFSVVFGSAWAEAGILAGLLGFQYLLVIISIPLANVLKVLRQENKMFRFEFVLLIVRFSSLWFGVEFGGLRMAILLYSGASSIAYFVYLAIIMKELKLNYFKILSLSLLMVIGIFLILLGVKDMLL